MVAPLVLATALSTAILVVTHNWEEVVIEEFCFHFLFDFVVSAIFLYFLNFFLVFIWLMVIGPYQGRYYNHEDYKIRQVTVGGTFLFELILAFNDFVSVDFFNLDLVLILCLQSCLLILSDFLLGTFFRYFFFRSIFSISGVILSLLFNISSLIRIFLLVWLTFFNFLFRDLLWFLFFLVLFHHLLIYLYFIARCFCCQICNLLFHFQNSLVLFFVLLFAYE